MKKAILLYALSLLLSMPIQAQGDRDHDFAVSKNIEIFNAIYRNLDMMYVDSLDADEVIGNGINGMLRALIPIRNTILKAR